jgi:putative ABC transport system ATP-binding protein
MSDTDGRNDQTTNENRLYVLSGVRKRYLIGAVPVDALAGIDVEIRRGEFLAIQGPSGSGKSTLLNVLGLIELPTGGSVVFRGGETVGLAETELTAIRRRSVGFIFQNFNLQPVLSALENVEYALYVERRFSARVIRERAMETLVGVGLEKFIEHKPAELSGGQRQRVAIARALVKNPEVILADEPTANLDSKTAAQILELMGNLQNQRGTTVIVATHDQGIGAMAGRRIIIRDGLVAQS